MKHVMVFVLVSLLPATAAAKLISMGPTDSYKKLESATAGDIVEIAPGTYKFRVMLTAKGTAANPIIIRAKDAKNRPVWDLAGKAVKDWPGSYALGDRGRGCWQIKGSHYKISGVAFKNCQDTSSAAIRMVNAGPLTLSHCLFSGNTNGVTGASSNLVVEFSEFAKNGKTATTGDTSHSLAISGGKLVVRYSYLHDATDGQHFNVRASDALLEYNWIARPRSYLGDLMTCEYLCGGSATSSITQKMVLRGNVIIQGQPKNPYKLLALYNDEPKGSSDSTGKTTAMELTMDHNTIIGTYTYDQRMVDMRNDTAKMLVWLNNNIIYHQYALTKPHSATSTNWTVVGKNNWVTTGTDASKLTGTLTGSDPGFTNATSMDYTLTSSSPCKGKAAALSTPPTREYYKDEKTSAMYRPRAKAKDIGAFEQGNAATPVGPIPKKPAADGPAADGPAPADAGAEASTPDASTPDTSTTDPDNGSTADQGADSKAGGDGDDDEGCSCAVSPGSSARSLALLLILGIWLATRRRRYLHPLGQPVQGRAVELPAVLAHRHHPLPLPLEAAAPAHAQQAQRQGLRRGQG